MPVLLVRIGHYPVYHGGVCAIRSFGRAGIPVHAIVEDRLTPAAASRLPRVGARLADHRRRTGGAPRGGAVPYRDRARHPCARDSHRRRVGRAPGRTRRCATRALPVPRHRPRVAAPPRQQGEPAHHVQWLRDPAARGMLPAHIRRRGRVRRARTIPRRREERRAVCPAAPEGRGRHHGGPRCRGADPTRRHVPDTAQRDVPGVHPARRRRGLDLPDLLRPRLPRAGAVHGYQASFVATARGGHHVRARRPERGARGALGQLLPRHRLPRRVRPRLALRSPRRSLQAGRLQPSARCAVRAVHD